MKLPSYKTLRVEDFNEDQRDLINKLALSVNSGFEFLYLALNNRLNFQDNFQSTIKDITISVNANGIPTTKTIIKLNDNNQKVLGCVVIFCQNLTKTTSYMLGAPFVSFTQTASGLQIDNVTGLIPGNVYQLRLLTI